MYLPDTSAALCEIKRVLKPGGIALLNTDNHRTIAVALDVPRLVWSRFQKLLSRLKKPEHQASGESVHTRSYAPRTFRMLVRRSGFDISGESGLGFGPITVLGKTIFPEALNVSLYKWAAPLYRAKFIGRTGFNYTVVAHKPE